MNTTPKRRTNSLAEGENAKQGKSGTIIGIIVALIIIMGGVVALWIIYRKYSKPNDKTDDEKNPAPSKPPSPNPKKDPEQPGLPPDGPTKPNTPTPPKAPVLPVDPAVRWPWVGRTFSAKIFYTERDGVVFQIQSSWVASKDGKIPRAAIRLEIVPVLTYIDWNDLTGHKGKKFAYFGEGSPTQGLLDLIEFQTANGQKDWYATSKLVNDDGKEYIFSLAAKRTEEMGMTPALEIEYATYGPNDQNPVNPILDVQRIVFEANIYNS